MESMVMGEQGIFQAGTKRMGEKGLNRGCRKPGSEGQETGPGLDTHGGSAREKRTVLKVERERKSGNR
jgi:hypothetical protein